MAGSLRGLHPLVLPAAATVTGAVVGSSLGGPAWVFVAIGLGIGVWMVLRAWGGKGLTPLWVGAVLGLVAMGLGAREAGRLHALEALAQKADGCFHEVVGIVREGPLPTSWGWRWVVETKGVDGRKVEGGVVVSSRGGKWLGVSGQRVRFRARLKPITSFANPGVFDYAAFMRRKGVVARAYLGRATSVELGGREGGLYAWAGRVRWKVGRWISRAGMGSGVDLVKAVVVGWRGALGRDVVRAFRRSATAHLLAISGLHLGMVWILGYILVRIGVGWAAALSPGISVRRWAAIGGLVLAGAYALISGASTPTIRALVMVGALTLGLVVGRPYDPWGGLCLAAIVIALGWPWAPASISLQLSMTAVAAVLVVGGWLKRLGQRRANGVVFKALGWAVVGLGVGVALIPLQMHYFHELPLVGPLANLVVVPLVAGVVLPLGLGGVGLGWVWETGGRWLVGLAGEVGQWAVELVRWLGASRWACLPVASPGVVAVVCAYAAGAAFVAGARRSAAVISAAAIVAGTLQLLPRAGDGLLRAWVVDVGQGMGCVVRLPGGKVMVVDGGGGAGRGMDVGRLAMGPLMWAEGIRRVWAVACTHPHPDHCSGLAFIVSAFRPQQVWTNGGNVQPGPYARMLREARIVGARVLSPPALASLQEVDGARIRALWPPRPMKGPQHDHCLWIGVGVGRCWVWMAGDASPREERAVAGMIPEGEHVLIAPHHGGRGSLTPRLLRAMHPRHIVFSAGCCNRFGMPSAGALARARKEGAKLWCTSTQGCISMVTGGSHWRLTPHLNPPRLCCPTRGRCGFPLPAARASSPPQR